MLSKVLKVSAFTIAAIGSAAYFSQEFKPLFRLIDVIDRSPFFTEVARSKASPGRSSFYSSYRSSLDVYRVYISNSLMDLMEKTQMKEATSIKLFTLNENTVLVEDDSKFLNVLLAMVDSQMGVMSLLLLGKKPCMTAHIDYNFFKEMKLDEKYLSYGFFEKQEGKNLWLRVIILDSKGEQVANFGSRFVKVDFL